MANPYSSLSIFNKSGRKLELTYNEEYNILQGVMYLPEVSTDLIENETLFILEEVNGDFFKPLSYGNIEANLVLSSDYQLFTVDNPYEEYPKLNFISKASFTATEIQIKQPLRVDFAVTSSVEKVSIDKIILTSSLIGNTICEISVYTEIIGEDERLTAKLADFGEYITANEEYIFRDSDIKEELTDHILFNQKKKEFILEMHNIKPYFASYKGIINILNLFDYTDLTLKEYWVDVKTGKFIAEDIKLYETGILNNTVRYNEKYKKTTFFGLYYPINHVVEDEFDEDGLPIVADSFIFSNEEILIKLFGLKNWIKNREIGGISSIIDIVGEITYFNKYDINFWYDDWNLMTESISQDILKFSINDYNDDTQIQLFINNLTNPDIDSPRAKIGNVISLKNLTFSAKIQDIGVTFEELTEAVSTYSIFFHNADKFKYYQIEWTAFLTATKEIVDIKYGKIEDLNETTLTLPHEGEYSIQMKLYKYNNEPASITKHTIIKVSPRGIIPIAFFNRVDVNNPIEQTPEYIELFDKYIPIELSNFRKIKFVEDDFMNYNNQQFRFFGNMQIDDITRQTFHAYGLDYNPNENILPFEKGITEICTERAYINISEAVFFTLGKSPLAGKVNANWKLIDSKGETVVELDNWLYFCYTFFTAGKYSLEITVFDNVGNSKTQIFNNFIVVEKYKLDY